MNKDFIYSVEYKLDKQHLNECFEQSVTAKTFGQAYGKSLAFVVVGLALLVATTLSPYLGSFIVALGIVEALSVRFQQPWWVTRQLLGKSGNNMVKISLDQDGISIESHLFNQQFLWSQVTDCLKTDKGFVLTISGTKQYISKSHLSEAAIAFMLAQVASR